MMAHPIEEKQQLCTLRNPLLMLHNEVQHLHVSNRPARLMATSGDTFLTMNQDSLESEVVIFNGGPYKGAIARGEITARELYIIP